MTAKKKMPIVEQRNMVFIPVGVAGGIYENAVLLANLIQEWQKNNPWKRIIGTPTFYLTPSSAGRRASIDCIVFTWETYGVGSL